MMLTLLQRNSFAAEKAPSVPDWMADLNQRAGGDGSGAKEKAERDARWVGEWADELTVAIALREWEQAVALIEQGQFYHSPVFSLRPLSSAPHRPLQAMRSSPPRHHSPASCLRCRRRSPPRF